MKGKVNLVAVLVAAIVDFGLGAAWFTYFAKTWIAGLRMRGGSARRVSGFEMRPSSFKLISAGYPFVGSILMGAIVGAWKKKAQPEKAGRASA